MDTPLAELQELLRHEERRLDRLRGLAESAVQEHGRLRAQLQEAEAFLELAPRAEARLEELATSLFGDLLDDVEKNLTHALREVLGQERKVVSHRDIKGNKLHIEFAVENDGNLEDILVGQGGSVCNIISVGLRLIALSRLEEEHHRPFLVLDEQDCWLKPELVPTFMKLIRRISHRLNIQTLAISHHPMDLFAAPADAVYHLHPDREQGVRIETLSPPSPKEISSS